MEYPVGTRYKFNAKTSDKYRKYRSEACRISQCLASEVSTLTNTERVKLFKRLDELRNKIFNLVPFNRQAFEKYADKMLNHTRNTILNDNFMTGCIINWSNIDIKTKEQFGSNLLGALDKQYRETDATVSFSIIDITDSETIADYDWDKNIHFQKDETLLSNPNEFIGALLHEFMHYLCTKHPAKSILGPQLSFIAAQHYLSFLGGPQTAEQLAAYKQQPFERYSYEIQDYVKQSDFTKNLLATISMRRAKVQQTARD